MCPPVALATCRFFFYISFFLKPCASRICLRFTRMLQRWAYAADALEELCPGASSATSTADLSRHWNPSPSPPTSHKSAGLVGVNGGNGGENHAADHDPPSLVATAASAAGGVSGVHFNTISGPMAASAEHEQSAAVNAGDGAGEASLDGVGASPATKALCAPSCSAPAASASPHPTRAAIPVAEAIAVPSAALVGPGPKAPQTGQPRQQEQRRPRGRDVLSLPAAACNEDTLVAVARELQEYAEAMARARSSREAKGGGKGGGGGRDVAGGALGAGALGAVSPSLYLQEPPPEGLFDALLDEVLLALGDA